jgi:AcrR family transcriptional regulator
VTGNQRERILEGTYAVVARVGMAKATMDDVAHQAGVSRATLYRAFPGGRDELLDAAVTWEVARFFDRIGSEIGPSPGESPLGVAELLERGLVAAHRALADHRLLQDLLRNEADRLVPSLATTMPLVAAAMRDWLRTRLERADLRAGVDAEQAAELLARTLLSLIGTPGRWDLDDPGQVRILVRRHLLAGVVTGAG